MATSSKSPDLDAALADLVKTHGGQPAALAEDILRLPQTPAAEHPHHRAMRQLAECYALPEPTLKDIVQTEAGLTQAGLKKSAAAYLASPGTADAAKRAFTAPSDQELKWLLQHLPLKALGFVFDHAIACAARDPKHAAQESLAEFVAKDTSGKAFIAVATRPLATPAVLAGFLEDPLIIHLANHLKDLLKSPDLSKIEEALVLRLATRMTSPRPSVRRSLCGLILLLQSKLLLCDPLTKNHHHFFQTLLDLQEKISTSLADERLEPETWLLRRKAPATDSATDGAAISLETAKKICLCLEQAELRGENTTALESLAEGLGLTPLRPGAPVAYNPLLHLDTVGGTPIGAPVVVTKTGWLFNGTAILRASVAP